MQFVPLGLSLALAAVLAPPMVAAIRGAGFTRPNYRGRAATYPAGVVVIGVSLLTVAVLLVLDRLTLAGVVPPALGPALVFVLGVALLGLVDDLRGAQGPRGVRGHLRVAASGRLSTGVLKGVGTLAISLLTASNEAIVGPGAGAAQVLAAAGVLALSAHAFNLLDLRPGRSLKALGLLGVGLTVASLELTPLWVLGAFLGPLLVLAPLDLRERIMLGDTGAGAVGALAGLWMVLALPPLASAGALALLVCAATYGEFRSISALIERTPLLRGLDSLGRS